MAIDKTTVLRIAKLARIEIADDATDGLAAELNATRSATADPRLRAIIDEIDLRARVEIAKYDRGR